MLYGLSAQCVGHERHAIKESAIAGHIFRRDHKHRRGTVPLPWISARGDLDYLRSTVKKIVRAAKLRDDLSFSSIRHDGFTEGADADLTDAELRAAGRHRSARQLPTYVKRTRKQLVSVATKRFRQNPPVIPTNWLLLFFLHDVESLTVGTRCLSQAGRR